MIQFGLESLIKKVEGIFPSWALRLLYAAFILGLSLYIILTVFEKACQVLGGQPSHIYVDRIIAWVGSFLTIIPDFLINIPDWIQEIVSRAVILVIAFPTSVGFLYLVDKFLWRFTEKAFDRALQEYFRQQEELRQEREELRQEREEMEQKAQELKDLEQRLGGLGTGRSSGADPN